MLKGSFSSMTLRMLLDVVDRELVVQKLLRSVGDGGR